MGHGVVWLLSFVVGGLVFSTVGALLGIAAFLVLLALGTVVRLGVNQAGGGSALSQAFKDGLEEGKNKNR